MKTLIIYATKHGCTAKVAGMLQSKLAGEVQTVNVKKDAIPSLNEFDKVILGGSIYVGKLQPELHKFITEHVSILLKKQFGLYLCAGENDPAARQTLLETVFPELSGHAIVKEVMGGEFNITDMNFLEKLAIRMITGKLENSSTLSAEAIQRFAQVMSGK